MKNLLIGVLLIFSILLLIISILNWCKIEDLKHELIEVKKQQVELKIEYGNFKTVANNEFIGMWRSLGRVRKNFIALKYNGLEGIDYGGKMQAKISH